MMRVAEALILRADYQKRLAQLKQRIVNALKIQEGDVPVESVDDLLKQVETLASDFQTLIQRINRTNIQTEFAPGVTLTDALAERDVLALRRGIYQEMIANATVRQDRFTRTEVKFQLTINVAQMQKQYDELAKAYRELDMKIQELNWRTDLL